MCVCTASFPSGHLLMELTYGLLEDIDNKLKLLKLLYNHIYDKRCKRKVQGYLRAFSGGAILMRGVREGFLEEVNT